MTAIISNTGELLYLIQGNKDIIELNKPNGCLAVEDPPKNDMFYDNGWREMPPKPSLHHIFDYASKEWVDPRSLEEFKAHKWAEVKAERDQHEFGGFEFNGDLFDSDLVAQSRINTAASLGVTVDWTTQSNKVVTLTSDQLSELLKALAMHVTAIHERGRLARTAILQSTTKQEVSDVVL